MKTDEGGICYWHTLINNVHFYSHNIINSYSASRDNWCTVGGNGGCRVGEVLASTTSLMPDHKGFKLQWLVNFQKFSTLRVYCNWGEGNLQQTHDKQREQVWMIKSFISELTITSMCIYAVTDGRVVRAIISVEWHVLSWSGGHESEPRLGWPCSA